MRRRAFKVGLAAAILAAAVLPVRSMANITHGTSKISRANPFIVLGHGRALNRPWDIFLRHNTSPCLEVSISIHHAKFCHTPKPATVVEEFARFDHRPIVLLGLLSSTASGQVELTLSTGNLTLPLKRLNQTQRSKVGFERPLGYLAIPLPGALCIEQLTITNQSNRIIYQTPPQICSDGP